MLRKEKSKKKKQFEEQTEFKVRRPKNQEKIKYRHQMAWLTNDYDLEML